MRRRAVLKFAAGLTGIALGYAVGGSKATAMTPQQFAAFIREETERWAPAIKASGARVE